MMGGVEDGVTEAIWQWCQDTSDIKGWDSDDLLFLYDVINSDQIHCLKQKSVNWTADTKLYSL